MFFPFSMTHTSSCSFGSKTSANNFRKLGEREICCLVSFFLRRIMNRFISLASWLRSFLSGRASFMIENMLLILSALTFCFVKKNPDVRLGFPRNPKQTTYFHLIQKINMHLLDIENLFHIILSRNCRLISGTECIPTSPLGPRSR